MSNQHKTEIITHELGRLEHALTDTRNLPSAYPILARYGYMERTSNGFIAIDPETIIARCRQLMSQLSAQLP